MTQQTPAKIIPARDLTHSRYAGDFREGETIHHGAITLMPDRNRAYIEAFGDGLILAAYHGFTNTLGYKDPDADAKRKAFGQFGIEPTALVSQGFLFNVVFGLSVHGISYRARANRLYNDLRYGAPVFEGDTISARSQVLGVRFDRDDSDRGDVQVRTTAFNQRGEIVLEYVRLVQVNAALGQKHAKSDTTKQQPAKISLEGAVFPNQFHDLQRWLLGRLGMTFEEFEVGKTYDGLSRRGLTLAESTWIPAVTMNDASVHYSPASNFIVYGGAVKAVAEGQVSGLFPLAWHLGMNSGTHDAPTYPSDWVALRFGGGEEAQHEQLRSTIKVVDAVTVPGRDDLGILTVQLTAEKLVTDAGSRALEAAGFRPRPDQIREEDGKKLLRVLSLEQVLAAPTGKAFA